MLTTQGHGNTSDRSRTIGIYRSTKRDLNHSPAEDKQWHRTSCGNSFLLRTQMVHTPLPSLQGRFMRLVLILPICRALTQEMETLVKTPNLFNAQWSPRRQAKGQSGHTLATVACLWDKVHIVLVRCTQAHILTTLPLRTSIRTQRCPLSPIQRRRMCLKRLIPATRR